MMRESKSPGKMTLGIYTAAMANPGGAIWGLMGAMFLHNKLNPERPRWIWFLKPWSACWRFSTCTAGFAASTPIYEASQALPSTEAPPLETEDPPPGTKPLP
ncbi:hypothetical protein M0R45_013744 [Rubus argutus]|uniref:Uncharacterized protein n=1 Tax=Rubus argutus TaxID=59490 RepID=A0AAW1XKA1_RUBAR